MHLMTKNVQVIKKVTVIGEIYEKWKIKTNAKKE